jgi:hypothetical protein
MFFRSILRKSKIFSGDHLLGVAGGDHFVRVAGGFGEMGRYAASIAWYCRLHVLSGMLDPSVR